MDKGTEVRYIGDSYKVTLIKGKTYTVLDEEIGWIQLEDEIDELAYFPSDEFEVVALSENRIA